MSGKKRRPGRRTPAGRTTGGDRDAALRLLSVSFLLGAGAGLLLGQLAAGTAYGGQFWQSAGECAALPPLWLEIWTDCRWPAALAVLNLLPMRGGTIPALFFLRGACLSYCVSALAASGTLRAIAATGIALGPTCFFTVPALFLLGTGSLIKAAGGRGSGAGLLWGSVLCVLLLALAVLTGRTLVPVLLSALLGP